MVKKFYGKGEIYISDCGFICVGNKSFAQTITESLLNGEKDKKLFGSIEVIIKTEEEAEFGEVKDDTK